MARATIILVLLMSLLAACSGTKGTNSTTTTTGAGSATTQTTAADTSGGEPPSNCSLITAGEATALAGHTLEVGQDSMLGCGFLPPGSGVADMSVIAFERSGDAASVAATDYPLAAETIPVSVGKDTVAVTTPQDDAVAAIITGDGGRFVELQVVFLAISPGDTSGIEAAAQLAVTALGRW